MAFTKGCRTMKIRSASKGGWADASKFGTLLYDLETDPAQEHNLHDPAVEKRMIEHLVAEMKRNDVPPEQFERLGLDAGVA
jgi:chorismate mutase